MNTANNWELRIGNRDYIMTMKTKEQQYIYFPFLYYIKENILDVGGLLLSAGFTERLRETRDCCARGWLDPSAPW